MFGNIPGNKSNIYEGDWSKFDQECFILVYFPVDWEDFLKIDELNTHNLTKIIYIDKIKMLLDTGFSIWAARTHAPKTLKACKKKHALFD